MKLFKLFLCFVILVSCKSDPKPNESEEKELEVQTSLTTNSSNNLNISLLLDLSDRIDPKKHSNPSMEYYQRDAAYVNSIAAAFKHNITQKKIILINDKIQLFFAPEPSNPKINAFSEKLKFHFTRQNVTNEKLEKFSANYNELPTKIYELAISDHHYVGSDTWKFMKDKVEDYCMDENYRNILVIFTDGYIFHKDNLRREENKSTYLTPKYIKNEKLTTSSWQEKYKEENYGFVPANKNLENLEVLVLGINPNTENDFEDDIIKKYWSDWLTNMGVKRFKIYNADLPANLENVMHDFINP